MVPAKPFSVNNFRRWKTSVGANDSSSTNTNSNPSNAQSQQDGNNLKLSLKSQNLKSSNLTIPMRKVELPFTPSNQDAQNIKSAKSERNVFNDLQRKFSFSKAKNQIATQPSEASKKPKTFSKTEDFQILKSSQAKKFSFNIFRKNSNASANNQLTKSPNSPTPFLALPAPQNSSFETSPQPFSSQSTFSQAFKNQRTNSNSRSFFSLIFAPFKFIFSLLGKPFNR